MNEIEATKIKVQKVTSTFKVGKPVSKVCKMVVCTAKINEYQFDAGNISAVFYNKLTNNYFGWFIVEGLNPIMRRTYDEAKAKIEAWNSSNS